MFFFVCFSLRWNSRALDTISPVVENCLHIRNILDSYKKIVVYELDDTMKKKQKSIIRLEIEVDIRTASNKCYESLRNIAPFVSQLSFFDNFRLVNFRI